ncbi:MULTISPECIES: hypothetical protein [unclassified Clostridium]|uniref:hypothetical protein n=1 Tax=unclassified Clostridium TaxID=2614128 RepID=UPI000298509D|nr:MULTISPECIES: hypothetical protein [unclassified Clostridium]EKQ51383.1 MAG: hypothetical protein A370_04910 [Clostridium sp. Maddingley MBC34-26]
MKKLKKLNLFVITIMIFAFISGESAFAKGSTSISSSSRSSSSVSRTSGSGFKTGSFSGSSKSSSSSNSSESGSSVNNSTSKSSTTTNSTKSVDTSSKALNNIPRSYSSHSVSNNYYYNTSNGVSDLWSNYWLYRALTPDHRTYVVDNSNVVAPAYTGVRSIIPDVITLCVIILVIGVVIYIIRKRRK